MIKEVPSRSKPQILHGLFGGHPSLVPIPHLTPLNAVTSKSPLDHQVIASIVTSGSTRSRRGHFSDTGLDPLETALRSDVWYEDSHAVLQMEHFQFKFHKLILGKHTDVFASRFAIQQAEGKPCDGSNGCVLLQFHNSCQDLGYILELYMGFRELGSVVPFVRLMLT